jgi:3-hydroxybutyrate dehydrogenase
VTGSEIGPLAGRRAVVTGSQGGLGSAIVETLRRDGADVVGVDVAPGAEVVADLASAAGVHDAIEGSTRRLGGLDILVLNAGVQHVAPLEEFPEEQWDRLHDVMVKGAWRAIRDAWPQLTARPGGRVVVVASTSAYRAERGKIAYDTAKTALPGLVRNVAYEGLQHGLCANAIAPTWMRTPFIEWQIEARAEAAGISKDEVVAAMLGSHPAGRFLEEQEAAEVVAFLASPKSSGITGSTIPVDAGELIA